MVSTCEGPCDEEEDDAFGLRSVKCGDDTASGFFASIGVSAARNRSASASKPKLFADNRNMSAAGEEAG